MKRIQSVADSKKTSRVVKYPLASTFASKSKGMRSILVLVKHELKRLSRNAGMVMADGFNYTAKPNSQAWPYPCPRPLFRTSWMFRTATMTSLHTVAMQLRILWMCVKWDDMAQKPPISYDGKNQVTTDSEIVTTEILKHRNIGRYMEVTQYWQRKISIPLDAPRKQVDYSPIRSGLRKRKRAESPVSADPRVEEVWVDELTLEPWEIRAYRDRVDRERERLTTRRQAGTIIKAPERLDPSEEKKSRIFNQNLEQIKQRTEESLRQQRDAFKAGRVVTSANNVVNNMTGIRTAGGSGVRIISTQSNSNLSGPPKKIFITKDGKVIGHQIAAPPGKMPIPNLTPTKPGASPGLGHPTPSVTPAASPVQQKVQIVKSADGKIQVRGLLPGQQLVQMPDGRLQIFSNQQVPAGAGTVIQNTQPQMKMVSPQAVTQQQVLQQSQVIQQQPQIIQQQLPQQQLLPKPSPVTAIQSPSKTYTIQRNPNVAHTPNTTPIQPKLQPQVPPSPAPQTPALPSSGATAATAAGTKQKVIGIQSLGNNTVTIKDGQLIVQGPDHAEATAIARKLAAGEAKLGNVGGKQVLVMLGGQEEAAPAPAQPAPVEPPEPPAPPAPAPVLPVTPAPQPQVTSVTVSAQLVQTQQGPRIILQGLQGIQLEQTQLAQIQQQVKTQLLKQQALARQQGKVPPTKVSIQLTGNFNRAQEQPQQQQQAVQTATNNLDNFDPPQLAVQPQQQQPEQPQSNSFLGHEPQVKTTQQLPQLSSNPAPSVTSPPPAPVASKLAAQPTITANLPQSVIKQGHFIVKDGKKVLVLPQNVLQAHQARQKAMLHQQTGGGSPPGQLPQHPQSLLLNSLTSPLSPQKSLLSPKDPDIDQDKFELTDDYIQQTIKSALHSGNLTLEQQEKLINQLDGSDMSDISKVTSSKNRRVKKVKPIDPASGEPMDDEWQPETWTEKRRLQSGSRKRLDTQEAKIIENDLDLSLDLGVPSPVKSSPSPVRAVRKVIPVAADTKRLVVGPAKLSSMLFKQKEQLKRDIAKKRSLLEKELTVDINREVESLKMQAQIKLNAQKGVTGSKRPFSALSPLTSPVSSEPDLKRRRRSDKSGDESDSQTIPVGIKKDRLYCVCKKKYDRTKYES